MQTIRIHTTIDVPLEKGFAAWIDPDHLYQWFTQKRAQRSKGYNHPSKEEKGTFLLFKPNKHLRFTWENPNHAPGTIVDIEFLRANDSGHALRLTHSGLKSLSEAEEMDTGWNWALKSLRSYLETGKPISFKQWQREQTNHK